jgi:prepilin-type N-terminal cleavage/methylation domain-containing protein
MRPARDSHGFTLVEVLVASALLLAALLTAARLFASAIASNAASAALSRATLLAGDKLEQLRAVGVDDPLLAASPPGTLDASVPPFFDAPADGFVRRWAIEPVANPPGRSLALAVQVTHTSLPGAVRLLTVRTRKAP